METLTKKSLADALAENQNMTKKAAAEVVNFIFDTMTETLKEGGNVDVNGFGKFTVKERAGRTGINPATKEAIEIAPSKVPSFKASKTLKDSVQ